MGKDVTRHYRVRRNGRAFWEPTPTMKAAGFVNVPLGPDGPDARGKALEWNDRWDRARLGLNKPAVKVWPRGALGEAWDRYRRTDTWGQKAERTREEWYRAWRHIEPIFGDVAPSTLTLEHLDAFYAHPEAGLLARLGVRESHRVIKVWRAFWRVAAASGYCERDADPSLAIRRRTPTPRSATWREGEAVRLVKGAIRMGYPGLASVIAVAWDTQFAPTDIRKLTPADMTVNRGSLAFAVARDKSGVAVIGTLTRRSERLIQAYLASRPAEALPNAPLFRNRSGRAYSKDTLGDDFRTVRAALMPGDTRMLGHDFRRSGTVEAFAGDASPASVSAKMGNSIDQSSELQRTYNPVNRASVALADKARKLGRRRIRENG